jgi:hypothetical protein
MTSQYQEVIYRYYQVARAKFQVDQLGNPKSEESVVWLLPHTTPVLTGSGLAPE